MKNLVYISAIALVAGLTACASDEPVPANNYRYAGSSCSDTLIKPAPQPVAAPVQLNNDCGGCPAREYTVRTPVQVVYKNTTYRTVYEPRTFETSSYETRPYNRAEVCSSGNCVPGQGVVAQPVMAQPVAQPMAPQPMAPQPVVAQPVAQY
ncbi:MAG: hypothetical protein IJ564_06635 [Alphaproteobacteria bacterium]|nr:hypothetical protein [Alphaproteobacteria bacterium]MBR3662850.1 hypothetical protein [Alphaproteobacteria bacterium]